MFTVSCYAFHPFILKFVRIWRYVQVVSEVLTCMLSMLCCQCMDMMPLSTSSSGGSKPSIQIFKSQLKNTPTIELPQVKSSKENQRPQHTVIDIPARADTVKPHTKSVEKWPYAQKEETFKDYTKQPEKDLSNKKSSTYSTFKTQKSLEKCIPATHHSSRKINKKDASMPSSITEHK